MKACLAFVACLVLTSSVATQTGASSSVLQEKERQLRIDLEEMRNAIDHYRGMADRGKFPTQVGSHNYPPDLETLVKGVIVQGKKIQFLHEIPIDPMTSTATWGLRESPGGGVFDVYTKSEGTALDGTKYKDW